MHIPSLYVVPLTLLLFQAGASAAPVVTENHIAKTPTREHRQIASCVELIQNYWPPEAKLMLSLRARLRESEEGKTLIVPGSVFLFGSREKFEHSCDLSSRGATLTHAIRSYVER